MTDEVARPPTELEIVDDVESCAGVSENKVAGKDGGPPTFPAMICHVSPIGILYMRFDLDQIRKDQRHVLCFRGMLDHWKDVCLSSMAANNAKEQEMRAKVTEANNKSSFRNFINTIKKR